MDSVLKRSPVIQSSNTCLARKARFDPAFFTAAFDDLAQDARQRLELEQLAVREITHFAGDDVDFHAVARFYEVDDSRTGGDEEAVADAAPEENPPERFRDDSTDTERFQGRVGGPRRAAAEVLAPHDDIAGTHA